MKKNIRSTIIRNIFIVMVLLFGLVSCNFLANKTIKVPKSMIQSKVEKKFPITKNYMLAKLTLSNPKVSFKEERLYIEANYSSSLLTEGVRGRMYLSSGIRFDQENEAVYLADLSIDRITDENGKELADSNAADAIKALIVNYVEMNPVYKIKEDGGMDNKKIKIKNMYIKKGDFFIQT